MAPSCKEDFKNKKGDFELDQLTHNFISKTNDVIASLSNMTHVYTSLIHVEKGITSLLLPFANDQLF